jgi:hypothetical protein
MDGTTSNKWPLFALNFALVHDPLLYNLDAISFADLTSLEVVLIGILKETCLSVKEVAGLLGKQLLTVIAPIHYGMTNHLLKILQLPCSSLFLAFYLLFIFLGGSQFNFEYSLETGDWSLLQKSSGNKNGGHKRCVLCGLDFNDSNSHQFQCYSHLISQIPKTLAHSVSLFALPSETNDYLKDRLGLKEIACLFSGVSPEERKELLSTIMKDTKRSIDNLHNVKGHLAVIVDLERQQNDFNDTLFLSNLNTVLGRLSTAGTDMNGKSFRKLAILFRSILLPSVAEGRRAAFSSFFKNWLEIQFFMYDLGELALRDCDPSIMDGLKVRMHLCTFVHLQQVFLFYFSSTLFSFTLTFLFSLFLFLFFFPYFSFSGEVFIWERNTRPLFS